MKQYGGLASLAGVSLPSGRMGPVHSSGFNYEIAGFHSDFVERREILPELMAVESWDAGSGNIVFDPGFYDWRQTWVRDVEPLIYQNLPLNKPIRLSPPFSVYQKTFRLDT